ncbi:AT-rich interactive domain-containing protein 4B-like isoform X2 [Lineus longissimus]|uniref:AT-rich interactive domain-containing protein 4B-like isoform X2 n=1 Tax=Lineus longissimus TaxID=88925 RepID=UPI00315D7C14
MMASGEPPSLPVGTDVSAKYRGAFCEAKVKKVVKQVKCKAVIKHTSQVLDITDEHVKTGPVRVGAVVEVRQDNGQLIEVTINKVVDASMYTVVFDDGDERTLRRTQLCLKGKKHFVESETLDQLPLTHPEHFGTPVMQQGKKGYKRGRGSLSGDDSSDIDSDSSDDMSTTKKRTYVGRLQDCIGKIVCVETSDKRKGGWFPALVVLPSAADVPLKTKGHVVVRSFRDNRFLAVLKKETKEFTRELALKNDEKALKSAIEKALLYVDNHELPLSWKKEELLGTDAESGDSDGDTSDDEPSEEKDRFVAQLYKFMDDRGTPINKAPIVGMKDLNLYRLFRVVRNIGGYNRVTNQMKWRLVWSKMGLPASNTASTQIKTAYKKYLHAFEDFYRKLGSSMGTSSRPSRSRHSSGRSLLSFRERDKESPRSPKTERKFTATSIREEKAKEEEDDDARSTKSDTRSTKSDTKSPTKDQTGGKIPREKAVTRSDEKKIKDVKVTDDKEKKSADKGAQKMMKPPSMKTDKTMTKTEEKKGSISKTDEKKGPAAKIEEKKGAASKSEEKKMPNAKADEKKVSASKVEEKRGPREFTRSASRTEERKAKEGTNVEEVHCSPKKALKGRVGDEKKGAALKGGKAEVKKEESKKPEKKCDEGKGKKGKVNKKEDETEKTVTKAKKDEDLKRGKNAEKEDNVKKGKKVERDEGKGKTVELEKEEPKGKKVEKVDTPVKKGKKDEVRARKLEMEIDRSKEEAEKVTPVKGKKPEEKKTEKLKAGDKVQKNVVARTAKNNDEEETKEADAKSEDEESKDEARKRPARKKSAAQKEWPPVDTGSVAKKAKEKLDEEQESNIDVKPIMKSKKTKSKSGESEDGDADDGHETDGSGKPGRSMYPVGTKLKVKYGRGRNHKVYEAKVVESEEEHGTMSYLVHYNGWNTRYDEWIRKDRIVSRVGPAVEPTTEAGLKSIKARSQSPKTLLNKGIKRTGPMHGPSPVIRAQSQDSKVRKPRSPRMRPTRSNSSEMPFPIGLPPKSRRTRRMSGHTESSDLTSHVSDSGSDDDETIDGQDEIEVDEEEDNLSKDDVEMKEEVPVDDVKPAPQEEEKPAKQTEKETTEQKESLPEGSDEDSNDIRSEQMELGNTLDEIINRIGDGEEDTEKKTEKKTIDVKTELPAVQESTSEAQVVPEEKTQALEIKKEVEEEKVEEKKSGAETVPSGEIDLDLLCPERLEPLVDIRKDSVVPIEKDAGVGIEGPSVLTGDAVAVKEEASVCSTTSQDPLTVDKLELEEVKKDGKKKKRSKDEGSGAEEHEKHEKKKGKKKRHLSKESHKDDDDEQDDGVVEKKKKRKKKDSGDAEAHGEKCKKKMRKKKKDYDDDSDATQSDFADIAKEMLKLKDEKVHFPVDSGAKGQYSVSAMFSGGVLGARSPQPSHSGANLLHDLASACEKAAQPRAMSSAVLDNTPPTTPEGSPTGAGSSASNISPCNEEVQSTKSEHEANIEVARYMTGEGHLIVGGESPNPCDTSIVSNCSGGSSGNVPSSESGTEIGTKRKLEEEEEGVVHKKKRRSRKGKLTAEKKHHSSKHHHASDSDELPEGAMGSPLHSQDSSLGSPAKKVEPRSPRPSKYNFYLDESEDIERDKKIEILQDRIGEIRKIYMQLKAEVALIDRRRKRARRKEREAAAAAAQQAKQIHPMESSPVCS